MDFFDISVRTLVNFALFDKDSVAWQYFVIIPLSNCGGVK